MEESARPGQEPPPQGCGHDGESASAPCSSCPVCVLLQALTHVRPEVAAHLSAATRELALAVRAAAEGFADPPHAPTPAPAPPAGAGPRRAVGQRPPPAPQRRPSAGGFERIRVE